MIGLDLAKETNDKIQQSILNENIAALYTSQKEYDQALEFYGQVKKYDFFLKIFHFCKLFLNRLILLMAKYSY